MDVPLSWQKASLRAFEPPDLLEELQRWLPEDDEVKLLAALAESDALRRSEALRAASVFSPDNPVLLLAWSATAIELGRVPEAYALAEAAFEADPGNAMLDLWRSRLAANAGDLPSARMLFFSSRIYSGTDLYGPRLEAILIGALARAGRLNPLSVSEAQGFFARLYQPPWEETLEVLREVFLDSLPSRPYDIRRRAPGAALRLAWAGESLRRSALQGPTIFWSGLREHTLGYAMEGQAWQFLLGHAQTFGLEDLAFEAEWHLAKVANESESIIAQASRRNRQGESLIFLNDFAHWSDDPGITVGEANAKARLSPYWRRLLRSRLKSPSEKVEPRSALN